MKKKNVLKTIIIAFSIVIAFFFLMYFSIVIFNPGLLGTAYFNIGAKDLSVKYSELAYEKKSSYSNLTTLVDRCISNNDDEKTAEYGEILLNNNEFFSKLTTKSNTYVITTSTSIAFAFYDIGKKEKAVDYSITYTSSFKTEDRSPVKYLIAYCSANSDPETLNMIITKLNNLNNEDAKILAQTINN